MLSIGAMQSGQVEYYQKLAREDYYLQGGEPPGLWLGRGAKSLGCAGVVKAKELSAFFQGYSPSGGNLVQNAGKANRQPGWDLTFSAPKSVSVLWSQLDGNRQQVLQAVHAKAVASAISYLEASAAFSRIGKGGSEKVPVSLVVAAFEHSCSRALDPQLHTHCLVMNLGVDEAGSVRTILSKPFYQAKMLAGAYYRVELSRLLQERLGVEIEIPTNRDGQRQSWFEVKGVAKNVLEHFSKRRRAILKELGERGAESVSAAAFAALSTREVKSLVPPRGELHAQWRQDGADLGFSLKDVLSCAPKIARDVSKGVATAGHVTRSQGNVYRKGLAEAVDELTKGENTFTGQALIAQTLQALQGKGVSAWAVAQSVKGDLERDEQFVSLGTESGVSRWTTKDILKSEKELLQSVEVLKNRTFRPVEEGHVATAIQKPRGNGQSTFHLDLEQANAVRYITRDKSSIKVVSGFAGTGKTDMLAAAREALEKEGYRVIGTALSGVAARNLEEKTGIPSETIRKRELQLDSSLSQAMSHHARQMVRVALGKPTYKFSPLTLDEKSVLVIDEAGMVGTRDFLLLAQAVVKQGGSVVAVGDASQLQSIERGGVFHRLTEKLSGVSLTEIRRQDDAGDRQAVLDVQGQRPKEALEHYAKKGQFCVGRTSEQTTEELIRDWERNGGAERPGEHRIFAATRRDVHWLNGLAQRERAKKGLVDPTEGVQVNDTSFFVGDKVRFDIADKPRGITKGESGTVLACKSGILGTFVAVSIREEECRSRPGAMTLDAMKHHARQLINAALGKSTTSLPPKKEVVVIQLSSPNPLKQCYHGLSLDYAMTTHLGQGQTVKNSYVLLGGRMASRELSYVQLSRHKESLFLYGNEDEVGHSLTGRARATRPVPHLEIEPCRDPSSGDLLAKMAAQRTKELATSIQERLRLEKEHAFVQRQQAHRP